jgi:hypothetical protein
LPEEISFIQEVANDAAKASSSFTKASVKASFTLALPLIELGILAFLVVNLVSMPAKIIGLVKRVE